MAERPDALELWVPKLFDDQPISLPYREFVWCRPDQLVDVDDALIPGVEPLSLVDFQTMWGQPEANIVLFRATPALLPPIPRRARLPGSWGSIIHRARRRPHDGYALHVDDRQTFIDLLVNHAVEETPKPLTWRVAGQT